MRHPTTRAFTLIELLMVIAIIGILASLLAGGIAQAKGRAHSITCMNNQRQLLVVWQKYAGDSDDRLVVNSNPVSSMTPLTTSRGLPAARISFILRSPTRPSSRTPTTQRSPMRN